MPPDQKSVDDTIRIRVMPAIGRLKPCHEPKRVIYIQMTSSERCALRLCRRTRHRTVRPFSDEVLQALDNARLEMFGERARAERIQLAITAIFGRIASKGADRRIDRRRSRVAPAIDCRDISGQPANRAGDRKNNLPPFLGDLFEAWPAAGLGMRR